MTKTLAKKLVVKILILLIISCSKPTLQQQMNIKGKTMGTFYTVKINGHISIRKKDLKKQIEVTLAQLNDEISTYCNNSALSRFNLSRKTSPQAIPNHMANIILMAQRMGQDTNRAMDITIGPLVNLWNFGPNKGTIKVPSQHTIAATQKKVGLQHLHMFRYSWGTWLQKDLPDIYIDLSTLGEGYGADELARLMSRNKITNYMVAVGGAISTHGVSGQGKPWQIAIQKPTDQENAVQAVVNLHDYSISTAGSYRNYFEQHGQYYSHIINPKTGKPINNPLISATVIASTALEADGWDTGLMVLGTAKALKLAKKKKLAVYLISKNRDGFDTVMTPQFKKFLVQYDKK